MRGYLKKYPHLTILFTILTLASFLRFYKLPQMASFDFDQEYAANFAYNVIKVYPIQLIGQGLSIEGIFLGPLYFYYLVPFFFFSNLHPIGGVIGSVLLGLVTVICYYFVIKHILGPIPALIAVFIRSFSFQFISLDWNMTPVQASDLVTLLTWLCFYKLWQGNYKFLPLLTLLFGLYTSIHPILLPFYLIFIILLLIRIKYLFRQKRTLNLKTIFVSMFTFIIPVMPLLIFEIIRKFYDVKKLLEFHPGSGTTSTGLTVWTHYLQVVFIAPYQNLGLDFVPSRLVFTIVLFTISFLAFKKIALFKDSFHRFFLLITFIGFLVYYIKFPLRVPEYYFLALTSLTTIYLSSILALCLKKPWGYIFLTILLLTFVSKNLKMINIKWNSQDASTNLFYKDRIVSKIITLQPKNQEFSVSYITNLGWKTGYDYLFKYYGYNPKKDIQKINFTIVSPVALSPKSINFRSGNIGIILPKQYK